MAYNMLTIPVLAVVSLLFPALPSQAESIQLPIASQGQYLGDIQRPRLGQSRTDVKTQFGAPLASHEPKGEPKIIRWDYQDFSVYFENEAVIHSVLKHRAQKDLPKGDSTTP
ncbi:phosphodiesterase [Oceanicoccus sp. KOV_DT_Chl]|uniref:phosphodiesterase n=1 Tax=Oceanicoccus sp. KOV_DT_Chl TaxID=1904639 RepID=UPI000C79983A|nr:phosphodiesterase [Oceanicoccus sp. KOV_DT_Chl]